MVYNMKFVVQPAYRLKIPILIASKPKHLMGQCQTRWSDSFTDFNCKLRYLFMYECYLLLSTLDDNMYLHTHILTYIHIYYSPLSF